MNMKVSDVLKAAHAELLVHGWCQGQLEDPVTGEICAARAIELGMFQIGGPGSFYRHLDISLLAHAVVRKVAGSVWDGTAGWLGVPDWNDALERTPEEVLDVFTAAIALAEQAECAAVEGLVETR